MGGRGRGACRDAGDAVASVGGHDRVVYEGLGKARFELVSLQKAASVRVRRLYLGDCALEQVFEDGVALSEVADERPGFVESRRGVKRPLGGVCLSRRSVGRAVAASDPRLQQLQLVVPVHRGNVRRRGGWGLATDEKQ